MPYHTGGNQNNYTPPPATPPASVPASPPPASPPPASPSPPPATPTTPTTPQTPMETPTTPQTPMGTPTVPETQIIGPNVAVQTSESGVGDGVCFQWVEARIKFTIDKNNLQLAEGGGGDYVCVGSGTNYLLTSINMNIQYVTKNAVCLSNSNPQGIDMYRQRLAPYLQNQDPMNGEFEDNTGVCIWEVKFGREVPCGCANYLPDSVTTTFDEHYIGLTADGCAICFDHRPNDPDPDYQFDPEFIPYFDCEETNAMCFLQGNRDLILSKLLPHMECCPPDERSASEPVIEIFESDVRSLADNLINSPNPILNLPPILRRIENLQSLQDNWFRENNIEFGEDGSMLIHEGDIVIEPYEPNLKTGSGDCLRDFPQPDGYPGDISWPPDIRPDSEWGVESKDEYGLPQSWPDEWRRQFLGLVCCGLQPHNEMIHHLTQMAADAVNQTREKIRQEQEEYKNGGIAPPIQLDGYFPLYRNKEDAVNASPTPNVAREGEDTLGYHTHILGGTTYFMPNGLVMGVTQFHGEVERKLQELLGVTDELQKVMNKYCDGYHQLLRYVPPPTPRHLEDGTLISLRLPQTYRYAPSEKKCANCYFYQELDDGQYLCKKWGARVRPEYLCNAHQATNDEIIQKGKSLISRSTSFSTIFASMQSNKEMRDGFFGNRGQETIYEFIHDAEHYVEDLYSSLDRTLGELRANPTIPQSEEEVLRNELEECQKAHDELKEKIDKCIDVPFPDACDCLDRMPQPNWYGEYDEEEAQFIFCCTFAQLANTTPGLISMVRCLCLMFKIDILRYKRMAAERGCNTTWYGEIEESDEWCAFYKRKIAEAEDNIRDCRRRIAAMENAQKELEDLINRECCTPECLLKSVDPRDEWDDAWPDWKKQKYLDQFGVPRNAVRSNSDFNWIGSYSKFENAPRGQSTSTKKSYKKNDIVEYNNKVYIATRDTSGLEPSNKKSGFQYIADKGLMPSMCDGGTF